MSTHSPNCVCSCSGDLHPLGSPLPPSDIASPRLTPHSGVMGADLQPLVFVLRAGGDYRGAEDARMTGIRYEFSATVIVRGNGLAEIIAGSGRITPSTWRDIRATLAAHGITRAYWDRYDGNGKVRRVWVD